MRRCTRPSADHTPFARLPADGSWHALRRAGTLTLLSIAMLCGGPTRAHASGFSGAGREDQRSRGSWAALLVGYIALGAMATGGAYLLRDNILGRGLAVGAAGWGGFGVGAATGYGVVGSRGCESAECAADQEVATGVGGLLGAAAGTLVGHLLTSEPGMSRPYATAAGFAPAFVYLTVGTLTDW